jgi:hypothetical protein
MRAKMFRVIAVVLAVMVCNLALYSQDKASTPSPSKAIGIDFSAGLNLSYNRITVEMGDDNIATSLEYSYMALQIDFTLLDFLTVGVVGGYNSNTFKDHVDFFRLPLTLRVVGTRFNSMMFGVRAVADLFSWRDFSITANGEALLFKQFRKTLEIGLPSVTGDAFIKNSFRQVALELLVHYEGFGSLTVFAGPQLHLLSGTVSANEVIETIDSEIEQDYSQKTKLGFSGGVDYELSSHIDVRAKISLFTKTSLSVSIFYVF